MPMKHVSGMQGAQTAESRRAAEELLKGIAPSIGPILSLPASFASTHVSSIGLSFPACAEESC